MIQRPSLALLLLLSFALAGLPSCAVKPSAVSGATAWEGSQQDQPIAVEAVSVSRDSLVATLSASGAVSGVNEAYVISETQGIIRSLNFALGDRVSAGQKLLKVDDGIAAANLRRAKDQLDSAELELKANEQLSESGGSSPAALNRARGAMSSARAQYEASLKAFNDTTVRSPIGGIIASREEAATIGNIIAPMTRVARIVDNSSFTVVVGFGEREISLIESGAKATVSVPSALGDQWVKASVTAVGAGSDPTTGSFPVVVAFANQWGNQVKSGMSATVTIDARKSTPSLVVPLSALVRRDGRYAVFVERDGLAQVREVTVGRKSGVRVEVLSGLSEGDVLLVSALSRLRDGVPVAVTNRGPSGLRE